MLEIIGMSVEDAKAIEYCGANRIELVSALTEGGLTPSFSMIEKVGIKFLATDASNNI